MRAQNFLRRTSLERKFRENLLFHGSLSYVDIVIVIALELARTVTFKHRLKARLQLKKKKKKAMRSKEFIGMLTRAFAVIAFIITGSRKP